MNIEIREVGEEEKQQLLKLIATDDLRPEGILEKGTKYWGAFHDTKLVGIIGCEYQGRYLLLRTALVEKTFRKQGIGERLTRTLLEDAQKRKITSVKGSKARRENAYQLLVSFVFA